MSDNDFPRQLRITSPCNMDWDSMVGNERVRFCEHCQLSVHNIDFASRKQIRRLIARSGNRLCVSYHAPPVRKETVLAPPVLHKIGRRTAVIAAGAFSATLSISSAVAATDNLGQGSFPNHVTYSRPLPNQAPTAGNGTLFGFVFDPNGAVIAGAAVSLTSFGTNEQRFTVSAGDGEYRFTELMPGTYHLKITARGFATRDIPNLVVRTDEHNRFDQTLSIAPIEAEVTVEGSEHYRTSTSGAAMVSVPTNPLVKAAWDDDLESLQQFFSAGPT